MSLPLSGGIGVTRDPVNPALTHGSVFRRAVTLAVALGFGISLIGLSQTVIDGPFALLVAVIGSILVAVAGTAISFSRSSLDWLVHRGLPQLIVSPRSLAFFNGLLWAVLAAAIVFGARGAFVEVPVPPVVLALVAGVALGVGTMHLHRAAHEHDAYRTFNLVAMLLACGSLASIAFTSDTAWYADGFSQLGTAGGWSAIPFNAAVTGAGVGVILLSGSFTRILRTATFRARRGGVATLRVLIALIGVSLMGVGAFPVDAVPVAHNLAACSAALAFAAAAVMIRFLVPGLPRSMVALSGAFLAAEVVAGVLYQGMGILSLTIFEVVAFTLVFAWLIALVATTAGVASPAIVPVSELIAPERLEWARRPAARIATGDSVCVAERRVGVHTVIRPPNRVHMRVRASAAPPLTLAA